ncbi:MAG: M67 family metallopeptidase [Bacteroidia bacterium]
MSNTIEVPSPFQIQLNATALNQLKEHGSAGFPDEICGFLYGKDLEVREITHLKPVINSKEGDQRRRFEISPLDYIQAERFALENGLDLLGVYHTHPNHPAIPSEHDLVQAMPYFSYIILSVREGVPAEIRSWRIDDLSGKFGEEKIHFDTEKAT